MARKPSVRSARDHFAALMVRHLAAGVRPASAASEPWTYATFADEVQSTRANDFVSARSVSNWCKGTALPMEIEPILRALFGPKESTLHGAARDALRGAFQAARAEKRAPVLTKARDPAGERYVPQGSHLVPDRTPRPTDRNAGADPLRRQLQAMIRDFAGTLAASASRLANTRTWGDLSKTAAVFHALAKDDPLPFADSLGLAYPLMLKLGGFLETDAMARAGAPCNDDPLDLDIHRQLTDLVRTAAPWLRGFPSVAKLDDEAGKALARPSLFEPARAFPQIALARALIKEQDAADSARMAEAVDPATFQGQKASARLVGDAWNLMLAAAEIRARADVVPPRTEAEILLAQRAGAALVAGRAQIKAFAATKPDDINQAMQALSVASETAADEAQSPELPIPEDVEAQARAMILERRAPPAEWRDAILDLSFLNDRAFGYLEPLSGLTSLQILDLRGTKVSDALPLSGLTGLQFLDLRGTKVSDASPLSGLTGLQFLYLSNTPVSDASPLSGLTGLKTLDLSDTQVSDASPLSGLTGLQFLYLSNTPVSDASPLSSLTGLQTLYLSNTPVSDASPLSGLTGLQSLDLGDTPVNDASPLSDLTGLQTLDLSFTPVSDALPLSGLTGLQTLYLSNTPVSDASPLSGLTGLQTLFLSNTPVSDASPLSGLTGLQTLSLSNTQVSDASPLYELPALTDLDLTGTAIKIDDVDRAFRERCRVLIDPPARRDAKRKTPPKKTGNPRRGSSDS